MLFLPIDRNLLETTTNGKGFNTRKMSLNSVNMSNFGYAKS